jgi:hypothetical protein
VTEGLDSMDAESLGYRRFETEGMMKTQAGNVVGYAVLLRSFVGTVTRKLPLQSQPKPAVKTLVALKKALLAFSC